jgi:mRNA interferase RelE/StbE
LFRIKLHPKVEKVIPRYPKTDQARITSRIRALAADPRPPGSVHLRDVLLRIRVGNYRVIYAVYDQILVVIVVEVARRSERTYEDLETLISKAKRLLED